MIRRDSVLHEGVVDGLSFAAWLKSNPTDKQRGIAVALSSRAALRVVPFLALYGNLSYEEFEKFLIARFLQLLIIRSTKEWPDVELRQADMFSASSLFNVPRASPSAEQAADAIAFASECATTDSVSFLSAAEAALKYANSENADGKIENWSFTQSDIAFVENGTKPADLHSTSLWLSIPHWWQLESVFFHGILSSSLMHLGGWQIWSEWYESIALGEPAFGLRDIEFAEALERKIVLGGNEETFNANFWSREPSAINAEISLWVAEARAAEILNVEASKPIFISYTVGDLDQAKRIGGVIDAGGYAVFAQFKDMPPGSNFVAEMQSGLATMGKFVPVYSPRYVTSEHCQAEWNAAYNMDPLGKRKLIVGFLLEKTELLPLQKQTVYVPLYGLTESQAKSAILSALRTAGAERTPLQTREAAKKYAVPIPETNAAGQLSFVPSADVEQPFIDDDIARLPSSMLRVLGHLLDALEGPNNAPQLVKSLLRGLQGELTVNGAMARVPDLQRDIEMLLAERGRALRDGAVWADGGFGTGINQLEAMFSSYRQNFPLVMVREIERRQAAIDPAKFDDAKFKMNHESIAAATEAMGDAGQTDASVAHVVFQRQRQRRDIEILGRYVPQGSDRLVVSAEERTVEELKKDFMFDESGLWDRTLGRVEKVASIADSTGGKALIVAAKEFLKSIWGG